MKAENYDDYTSNEEEIDLRTCSAEIACLAAECEDIDEADARALLAREDVDTDYSDIYFFAMQPYLTIREALNYYKHISNEEKSDIDEI